MIYLFGYLVIGLIFATFPIVLDKGPFKYEDFYYSFIYRSDLLSEDYIMLNGTSFILATAFWPVVIAVTLFHKLIEYIGLTITIYHNKQTRF